MRYAFILALLTGCAFGQCGPLSTPPYSCVTTSTSNPGIISSLFISTAPTATTCSGDCLNAVKYDTTLNLPPIAPITRMTDGSSLETSGKSIGNLTNSGGANDGQISANETYFAPTDSGGRACVLQVTFASGPLQVVNTGIPAICVNSKLAFSNNVANDNVFYAFANSTATAVLKYVIANINVMPTPTTVFDFGGGTCPGIPTGSGYHPIGIFPPSNDTRFTFIWGNGNQGFNDWLVSYDTTLGCAAVNFSTGQYFAFCASGCNSSTPATGTLLTTGNSCWGSNGAAGAGIHDLQAGQDGTFVVVSIPAGQSWTKGQCAGDASNTQLISYQIGTNVTSFCDASSNTSFGGCSSHQSVGTQKMLAHQFSIGQSIRPLSALGGGFTAFAPELNAQDWHQSWLGHNVGGTDLGPWVGATSTVAPSAFFGCSTGSPYCPTWPNNMVVATFPSGTNVPVRTFAHTFTCPPGLGGSFGQCTAGIADGFGAGNAIGIVSPKGNYFCWASSMLQSLGNDNTGVPRADAFCVRLGSPSAGTQWNFNGNQSWLGNIQLQ